MGSLPVIILLLLALALALSLSAPSTEHIGERNTLPRFED